MISGASSAVVTAGIAHGSRDRALGAGAESDARVVDTERRCGSAVGVAVARTRRQVVGNVVWWENPQLATTSSRAVVPKKAVLL